MNKENIENIENIENRENKENKENKDNKENPSITIDLENTLKLILFNEKHLEEYYQLIEKNRIYLKNQVAFIDFVFSLEDVKKFFIPRFLKPENDLTFSINKDGKIIGAIGIHNINKIEKNCTMGYWLDNDCRRKGIMTQAIKALIKYCFNYLNLEEIQVDVKDDNISSQNLAIKNGFIKERIRFDKDLKWNLFEFSLKKH